MENCLSCGNPQSYCMGTCSGCKEIRDFFDQEIIRDIRQWQEEQKTKFVISDKQLNEIETELDKIVKNENRTSNS